jgi:hypothetical protein
VLWADELVVFSALWLTWSVLALRDERWRVPATLATGAIAFALMWLLGHSLLVRQLIALAAVLAAAVIQVPGVFARPKSAAPVPNPRMTVVLFRELPFVLYGTAFFAFLFAGRLLAVVSPAAAVVSGSVLPGSTLALDLAVMAMLLASAGAEYASVRFAYHIDVAKQAAFTGGPEAFHRAARHIHLRALAITAFTFVVTVSSVSLAARLLDRGIGSGSQTTFGLMNVAYFLFALGLLNTLVLLTVQRPWRAITILTAGTVVAFAIGYVLSRTGTAAFAEGGTLAGATVILIASTMAVRRTLRRADHAVVSP